MSEPETIKERYEHMKPQCAFGSDGICCRICLQGPCRITKKGPVGICGAHDYTIVSRNLIRMIAAGAAAHGGHGQHIAKSLLAIGKGKSQYKVRDENKLKAVAERVDCEPSASALARKALEDFSRQEGEPAWMTYLTPERLGLYRRMSVMPIGIEGAISEVMHRTVMGVDADPISILFGGIKCALADYAGMHISSDLSDVILGTPQPVLSKADLGVLEESKVNVAVHGHMPLMSDSVYEAAKELESEAKDAGASGINVVGICCTGGELLMRKGIPMAANYLQQELAIMTGALDAMVVDVQCIMPSLTALSECYHTRIVTTTPLAHIPGATHIEFSDEHAKESAKMVVRMAIGAYKNRKGPAKIPKAKSQVVAGFSFEAFKEIFGEKIKSHIEKGELLGVALLAGCNNVKVPHDQSHITVAKELAKNDVLLLATGCAAGALAKAGLMTTEAVDEHAGPGLKKVLKELSKGLELPLPLALHMGSCVDNTRAEDVATFLAGEFSVDTDKIPMVASAPEAMSEKAIAIGTGAVVIGLPTHVGVVPHIEGSDLVHEVLTRTAKDVYGGYFIFEKDPKLAAVKLIKVMKERRRGLGLK